MKLLKEYVMDFHQLEYFADVAKTQNMGQSAENLHISQPALSMSIKRLENELGVELFDRHNHSIFLNSYGRLFLRYAEYCIKDLNEGKKQLNMALTAKTNTISIMCPVYYLTGVLFDAFCSVNPSVTVEYHFYQYWMIEEALLNKTLDICITSTKVDNPQLENVFITSRTMGVLCPEGHRFEGRDAIVVNDLRNEKHLSFPENKMPRYDLDMVCSNRGFRPNVVFESDSFSTLLQMCKKGKGILQTSLESTKLLDMRGLFFVPYESSETDAHVKLYMVTRKNGNSPFMDAYKAVVMNALAGESPVELA